MRVMAGGALASDGGTNGCGVTGAGPGSGAGVNLGKLAVGPAEWGSISVPLVTILLAGWPMLDRCGATGCVGVLLCPWKRQG